jgi:hypothetical protein
VGTAREENIRGESVSPEHQPENCGGVPPSLHSAWKSNVHHSWRQ